MPLISVVFIVLGAAMLVTGIFIIVRVRRVGGIEIGSRQFFVIVILCSMGAALLTVPVVQSLL